MSEDERSHKLIERSLSSAKQIRSTLINHKKECIPAIQVVIDSLEADLSRRAVMKLEGFKQQPSLSV